MEVDDDKDTLLFNAADEDTNDSTPNTVAFTEEGYVLEDANGDDVLIKLEQETTVNAASTSVPVKEEYSVQIQEEDDDFVEIYEPMTEEEEKEVFQLADEAFENDVSSIYMCKQADRLRFIFKSNVKHVVTK